MSSSPIVNKNSGHAKFSSWLIILAAIVTLLIAFAATILFKRYSRETDLLTFTITGDEMAQDVGYWVRRRMGRDREEGSMESDDNGNWYGTSLKPAERVWRLSLLAALYRTDHDAKLRQYIIDDFKRIDSGSVDPIIRAFSLGPTLSAYKSLHIPVIQKYWRYTFGSLLSIIPQVERTGSSLYLEKGQFILLPLMRDLIEAREVLKDPAFRAGLAGESVLNPWEIERLPALLSIVSKAVAANESKGSGPFFLSSNKGPGLMACWNAWGEMLLYQESGDISHKTAAESIIESLGFAENQRDRYNRLSLQFTLPCLETLSVLASISPAYQKHKAGFIQAILIPHLDSPKRRACTADGGFLELWPESNDIEIGRACITNLKSIASNAWIVTLLAGDHTTYTGRILKEREK